MEANEQNSSREKEERGLWRKRFEDESPELYEFLKDAIAQIHSHLLYTLVSLVRPKAPKGMQSISDERYPVWEMLYMEARSLTTSEDRIQLLSDTINHDLPRRDYPKLLMALQDFPFMMTVLALTDKRFMYHFLLIGAYTHRPTVKRLQEILGIDSDQEEELPMLYPEALEAVMDPPRSEPFSFVSTYPFIYSYLLENAAIEQEELVQTVLFYENALNDKDTMRNELKNRANLAVNRKRFSIWDIIPRVFTPLNSFQDIGREDFELMLRYASAMEAEIFFTITEDEQSALDDVERLVDDIAKLKVWDAPAVLYVISDLVSTPLESPEIAYILHVAARENTPQLYSIVRHRDDVLTDAVLEQMFRESIESESLDVAKTLYEDVVAQKDPSREALVDSLVEITEQRYSISDALALQQAWMVRILIKDLPWTLLIPETQLLKLFDVAKRLTPRERYSEHHHLQVERHQRTALEKIVMGSEMASKSMYSLEEIRSHPILSKELVDEILSYHEDPLDLQEAAIYYGMWGLLQSLVRYRYDVDADKIVQLALENDKVELLIDLIDTGVVDVAKDNSWVLRKAAEVGDLVAVKILLDFTPVDIHSMDDDAFFSALHGGHVRVARLLMRRGDIDITQNDSWALVVAVMGGSVEAVSFVLWNEAIDPTGHRYAALIEAASADRPDLFQAIVQYIPELPPSVISEIEAIASEKGISAEILDELYKTRDGDEEDDPEEELPYSPYDSADVDDGDFNDRDFDDGMWSE